METMQLSKQTSGSSSRSKSKRSKQHVLSSQYVSFGHVVRAQDPLRRDRSATESTVATPVYKKEISLFPLLDKFILYTPTYTIQNRSKKWHIPLLILVGFLTLGRIINHILYLYSYNDGADYQFKEEMQLFTAVMLLLPLINNVIRIHFFLRHFTFKLWHYPSYINPTSGITTINNQILDRLSFLLRRPAAAKLRITRDFRTGWALIMLIILCSICFRIVLYYNYSGFEVLFLTVPPWFDWLYAVIWSILYALTFDIPDLLYLLVARIHFIECTLDIRHFAEELGAMSLDEIVESNLYRRYCTMYSEIQEMLGIFKYFIGIMTFEVLFGIWYGLNFGLSPNSWTDRTMSEGEIPVTIAVLFWFTSVVVVASQLLFALWPAFEMTRLNGVLVNHINLVIDDIMRHSTKLYEESMMTDFMDVVCKWNRNIKSARNRYHTMKFSDKTAELKKQICKYSNEKAALDILNQLLCVIEEKSCSYRVLGVTVDKSSLKHVVVALILLQIFSLMWAAT